MTKRTLKVMWRKNGETKNSRCRSISIDLPVERETTALEDAILRIPENIYYLEIPKKLFLFETMIIEIDKETETLTDEMIINAITLNINETTSSHEQEIKKERANYIDRVTLAINGDLEALESIMCGNYIYDSVKRLFPENMPKLEKLALDLSNKLAKERAEKTKRQEDIYEKESELRKRKEQEEEDKMDNEIQSWVMQHGSDHAKEMLAQGLDPWPLYLRERLEFEFTGLNSQLDNDSENERKEITKPSEHALKIGRSVANRLMAIGQAENMKEAFKKITYQKITGEDWESKYVVTSWRPGSELFGEKQVKFIIDD